MAKRRFLEGQSHTESSYLLDDNMESYCDFLAGQLSMLTEWHLHGMVLKSIKDTDPEAYQAIVDWIDGYKGLG